MHLDEGYADISLAPLHDTDARRAGGDHDGVMRVWLNRFAVLLLVVPEAVLAALWLLTRQRVWAVVLAAVTLALVAFAASAMRARVLLRRGWAAAPPGATVETVAPPEPPEEGWPEIPHLEPWGRLGDHAHPVTAVAFSPHGRVLATVDREGTLQLWDTTDPTRPVLLGQASTGCRDGRVVRFAPDGQLLAVAGAGIVLWDVTDPAHPRLTATLAASPRRHQRQHTLAFHPTGRLLATGQARGIWVWDVTNTPQPLNTDLRPWRWHNAQRAVQSLTFTPDGHHLIADGGNTIVVLDTTDPARAVPVARAPGLAGETLLSTVHDLVLHPGGRFLIAAHRLDDGEIGTPTTSLVVGWDLTDPHHPTQAVKLVDAWDIPGWAPGRRPRPTPPMLKGHTWTNAVALNPDGTLLATAGQDHTLLWDARDLPRLKAVARLEPSRPVTALAFSPDGHVLATTDGTTTTLWNPAPDRT
jgi:WD40 repeat protein